MTLVLCDLGKYLFLSVCKEWITLESICTLDSAMCCSCSRQTFLKYLASDEVTFLAAQNYFKTQQFSAWINVRRINISHTTFFNSLLTRDVNIFNLKALSSVQMTHCWKENEPLLNSMFEIIGPSLRVVELTRTIYIESNLIATIATHCQNIVKCDFESLYNLVNQDIITLSQSCRRISSMNLAYCGNISDPSVIALCENCPDLTALNVSNCRNVTDASLNALSERCSEMQSLNITHCDLVTEAAVKALVERCPLITDLSLAFCRGALNDRTLASISQHLKGLRMLNIGHSNAVTDQGIEALCRGCTGITDLNIQWMSKITVRAIAIVAANLFHLRKIIFENTFGYGNDKPFALIINNFKELSTLDSSNGTISGVPHYSREDSLLDPAYISGVDVNAKYEFDRKRANGTLAGIFPKCTRLTHLTVCSTISSDATLLLPFACPLLTTVNLEFGKEHICDRHLQVFAEQCRLIESFSIQKCALVTDLGVVALVRACTGMLRLNIAHCTKVTDMSVMAVATYCPKIQYLNIARCQVKDNVLIALAHKCRHLRYLNATGCHFESTLPIRLLTQNCAYLTDLIVSQCEAVSAELSADFLEKFNIDVVEAYEGATGDDREGTAEEEGDSDSDDDDDSDSDTADMDEDSSSESSESDLVLSSDNEEEDSDEGIAEDLQVLSRCAEE